MILLATIDNVKGASPSVFMLQEDVQRTMDSLMHGYKLKQYDFTAQYGK